MALNLNEVRLAGRLTADPELKTTTNGTSVVSFGVAVNRVRGKNEEQQTDFFDVVAWKTTAEFISKYFRKGNSIYIAGTLQTRSWTDQNGQKRSKIEVIANSVDFVENKPQNVQEQPASESANAKSATPKAADGKGKTVESEAKNVGFAVHSNTNFEEVADDTLPF